jgi:abortive infection bacteriophage resistance protein
VGLSISGVDIMVRELKPPLSYQGQVDLLKSRNLIIENETFAEQVLSHINYYRLSAYGLGLHDGSKFQDHIKFEALYRLYEFDVKIRYILLQAIEFTEVMFRTKIAYHMATKYNSESYLDVQFFQDELFHKEFVDAFTLEKHHQRNAAFIKHHEELYGGKMPIWVAVEIFSFGMLSRFYGNMIIKDQWEIARFFNTSPVFIRSWLKCLVEVRNICAHYGRIYNRILSSEPKMYFEHQHIKKRRIFVIILVLKRLLNHVTIQKTFTSNIRTLIEEYDDVINLSYIGFPEDWNKLLGEYIVSK